LTSILLIIVGFAATLGVMILRALALDEVKGRIQRRITKSVEATIASLPAEMQDEWGEEWRAEIAAVITLPLTAARTAHGLRQSASQLIADPAVVPTGVRDRPRLRLKLGTTKTFMALSGCAAGTSLLLLVLDTTAFRKNFDETIVRQLFTSEITGLFILVLGVIGMTGEWRHRTITSSVLAAGGRLRLLGAKLISHAVMGALLSLIVTVMIMLLGTIILFLRNKTTLDVAALLDVLWRNLMIAAYLGAIGVCLGALLRNQVAAVVGVLLFCWIVETTLLGQVPQVGRFAPLIAAPAALVRYDPTDGEGLPGGDDALEPAIAGLVMLGWLAALYAIAGVLLRRRHLT
jgi:ABC-2 type transport system permease protein